MKTLKEYRKKIENEIEWVDVKPYSHNIISLCLMAIDKEYGTIEANKTIDDFGLKELGWRKQRIPKCNCASIKRSK